MGPQSFGLNHSMRYTYFQKNILYVELVGNCHLNNVQLVVGKHDINTEKYEPIVALVSLKKHRTSSAISFLDSIKLLSYGGF